MFKDKIEASTVDAYHKPLAKRAISASSMAQVLQDEQYQDIYSKYINEEPKIRCTTKATELAVEWVDDTPQHWTELVPYEYHKFGKVFSDKDAERFPKKHPWDHAIDLIDSTPPMLNCKTYPLGEGQQAVLDKFIDEHLKKGYIRRSNSPYASPFFFVKKKDGKQQPVQDYCKLNELTVRNTYPLPLIKELVWQLIGKEWFTKFDVWWGYNNVRIKEGDERKAAFKTNQELFEPTVVFFELTNSLATFQTMMDTIFREEIASGDVIIYMDNILIATKGNLLHHHNKVTFILKKLQDNNLFLKLEKCLFHKKEVEYLGVIVGKGQVKMDPTKVDTITTWPEPRSVTQLWLFLGFGNYYKDFIKDYSKIAKLLHDMTTKKANWEADLHLSGPSLEVFTKLKCLSTSCPVLRNPDPAKQYILDTNVSAYAVGATISQDFKDGRHPIAYFSKSLLPAEHNYDIYDQELLAIIYAVKAFRYLLLGAQQQFLIWSDHENLKYFKSPQKITTHQACWQKFIQDYNFKLEHFCHRCSDTDSKQDSYSHPLAFEAGILRKETKQGVDSQTGDLTCCLREAKLLLYI